MFIITAQFEGSSFLLKSFPTHFVSIVSDLMFSFLIYDCCSDGVRHIYKQTLLSRLLSVFFSFFFFWCSRQIIISKNNNTFIFFLRMHFILMIDYIMETIGKSRAILNSNRERRQLYSTLHDLSGYCRILATFQVPYFQL